VVVRIGRQQGGRIGLGRGAHDQQHVAAAGRPLDRTDDVVADALLEPDHVRTQRCAAAGAGRGQPRARVVPGRRRRAVARAAGASQVAVQLDDVRGAGALVQAVDVERHDEAAGNVPREIGQGDVAGVGQDIRKQFAPPRVPIPDELGIAGKRRGCRELERIEAGPHPRPRRRQRGDAGLGGKPAAGQRDDRARAAQFPDQGGGQFGDVDGRNGGGDGRARGGDSGRLACPRF
jgi:hypothetical protein